MHAVFALRLNEHTLFRSLACRIHDQSILGQGLIYVTSQRVFFQAGDGSGVALERGHIVGITRRRFGFLPALAVQGVNDFEVSLIAPDGWGLDNAVSVLAGETAAVHQPIGRMPERSRVRRAFRVLGMAFVATGKALLAEVGLWRYR